MVRCLSRVSKLKLWGNSNILTQESTVNEPTLISYFTMSLTYRHTSQSDMLFSLDDGHRWRTHPCKGLCRGEFS